MDCEDGLVDKALAKQARGPEFRSLEAMWKLSMAAFLQKDEMQNLCKLQAN